MESFGGASKKCVLDASGNGEALELLSQKSMGGAGPQAKMYSLLKRPNGRSPAGELYRMMGPGEE